MISLLMSFKSKSSVKIMNVIIEVYQDESKSFNKTVEKWSNCKERSNGLFGVL